MYTQFFGNYLLSHDYISKEQLFAAMKKQSETHMRLGTMAIHKGYMAASEVDHVIIEQTHVDKKFGELAIELGYMTNEQVIDLLKTQKPDFLLIGQILVDDGAISNQDLENAIHDYCSTNGIGDLDMYSQNRDSIDHLFNNFFTSSETAVSKIGKMYLELLFNNFIRFVGDDYTPLAVEEINEFPTNRCVSQSILKNYELTSYIDMDEDVAIEFASRYAGDKFTAFDEYVQASLEDFLNLHNGLFVVNTSNEFSLELEIGVPTLREEPTLKFEKRTYLFPVHYSFGVVHFILEVKEL